MIKHDDTSLNNGMMATTDLNYSKISQTIFMQRSDSMWGGFFKEYSLHKNKNTSAFMEFSRTEMGNNSAAYVNRHVLDLLVNVYSANSHEAIKTKWEI